MPDITISLIPEEIVVLKAFYASEKQAVNSLVKRKIKTFARDLIEKSDSKLDPNKLSNLELRDEIRRLNTTKQIPEKKIKKDKN